jgi:PhzF family phenazine biosynthesis protein
MGLTITTVDAFTDKLFAGSPAAVCLLAEAHDDRWMQQVASEMNLAETAYLERRADGYGLRWFTPVVEVDLCGHATLASAHVLWETGEAPLDETLRFHTRSGLLTARRAGEWIELDFPAEPAQPMDVPTELIQALGVQPLFTGKNRFDYLVEVEFEETIRRLQPDIARLKAVTERGVIVTAKANGSPYDFVSRFFAPAAGIDEDPVTGSAHCCLGPFWQQRLGKAEFLAYQASPRGGAVRVHVRGGRVGLGGQAVTVWRGELWV